MSTMRFMQSPPSFPDMISVADVVGNDAAHPRCPKCGGALEQRAGYHGLIWACGDAHEPHFTIDDEIIQSAIRREQGA